MCEKSKTRNFLLIFFLACFVSIFSSLFLMSTPADAVDELYLTGVVSTIDLRSGIVFVQVQSGNCRGLRKFRFDNTIDMEGLQGKKISFSINSSVCKAGEIYKITTVAPVPEVRTR